MHREKFFLLIFLIVVTGMPLLPVAQRQKQDIPYSHKYLVSFALNLYFETVFKNLSVNKIHESAQKKDQFSATFWMGPSKRDQSLGGGGGGEGFCLPQNLTFEKKKGGVKKS